MSRVTFKILRQWISEWNEGHEEMPLEVHAFNDYYHITTKEGSRICANSTPGKTWEDFSLWRNGYRTACNMFTEGKLVVLKAKGGN